MFSGHHPPMLLGRRSILWLTVVAVAMMAQSCTSEFPSEALSANQAEPAVAVLEQYKDEWLRQLQLPPDERDVRRFELFFAPEAGNLAEPSWSIDLIDSRVLEVLSRRLSFEVVSFAADDAVIEVRDAHRYLWESSDEPEPYTETFDYRQRFVLERIDGRWVISAFG